MNFTRIAFSILIAFNINLAMAQVNWVNEGDNQFKFSNSEKAIVEYDKHLELYPQDAVVYLKRAKAYAALNRFAEMDSDLIKAKSINPYITMHYYPPKRLSVMGVKKFELSEGQDLSPFKKSLIKPNDYITEVKRNDINNEAHEDLSEILITLKKGDLESVESLLASIEMDIENEAILYDLFGMLHFKKQEHNIALDYFSKAISIAPDFAMPYYNRAVVHNIKGDLDMAHNDLEKAISLNDRIPSFYFALGEIKEKRANYNEARDAYSKATEIDNSYYQAWTNKSVVLKKLGDYNKVHQSLEEALLIDPLDPESACLEGNLEFLYGHYDKAIDYYSSFVEEHPEDYDAYYNMGLSYLMLEKNEEGCEMIEHSLDLEYFSQRLDVFKSFCGDTYY